MTFGHGTFLLGTFVVGSRKSHLQTEGLAQANGLGSSVSFVPQTNGLPHTGPAWAARRASSPHFAETDGARLRWNNDHQPHPETW